MDTMKYYVVSDIHSFYSILIKTLEEKGFFADTEPHKLVICGDLFDRGKEALKIQAFILELMQKDEVILIRGNHEDLLLSMLDDMASGIPVLYSYHRDNGTVDTVKQLLKKGTHWFDSEPDVVISQMRSSPILRTIIPAMKNYFETKNYIFVHGWIPCHATKITRNIYQYAPMEDWRNASEKQWDEARWINGMEAAYNGITETEKTIVCGHWHTSFGHAKYEGKGTEKGADADLSTYYANGIIALDACTSYSKKINCIVIEDEPLD